MDSLIGGLVDGSVSGPSRVLTWQDRTWGGHEGEGGLLVARAAVLRNSARATWDRTAWAHMDVSCTAAAGHWLIPSRA